MNTEPPIPTMSSIRSFTYPLSQPEQQAQGSPFALRQSDTKALESSEAFQLIRSLLSTGQCRGYACPPCSIYRRHSSDVAHRFCAHHRNLDDAEERVWLLQRDITHAIIFPVLHIYRQAVKIAQSFLCSESTSDLELAFREEARGTFSWLQCLVLEEGDWCMTRGCPGMSPAPILGYSRYTYSPLACVVTYVLESEPTIRLILAACRLSRSLRKYSIDTDPPLFDFWRSSLRKVLDKDPFWGPAHAKVIEERAEHLEQGFLKLIQQCCELSDLVADAGIGACTPTQMACPTAYHAHTEGLVRKRSILLAKYQSRDCSLDDQDWLRRSGVGCWSTLLADAASMANKTTSLVGQERHPDRRSSLSV